MDAGEALWIHVKGVGVAARLCGASEACLRVLKALPSWPRLVFTSRSDLRAKDVVLSELLNRRGPGAWLTAAPDSSSGELCLATLALNSAGTVLVLTACPSFDLILVPREACFEDGVAFAAFATRTQGVNFMSSTLAARQVAVVLDLDSTLLESEQLQQEPREWHSLEWQKVGLTQEPCGSPIEGRLCPLPDEPHHAEGVHAVVYEWQGVAHNYRVRLRLGWSHLRELLSREAGKGGKLSAYVLSLGRPPYIQTAWRLMDPDGQIIHPEEYGRKVNSARPNGVSNIHNKTPCIGTGLRDVFAADFNMRLGPVWCVDDMPQVYSEQYRDCVYPVAPYRPVAVPPRQYDDGSVLRDMSGLLEQYWEHCYGADGQGGAAAMVAAAAARTLHRCTAVPLPSTQAAARWSADLFLNQHAVSTAMSVRAFLQQRSAQLLVTTTQPSTAQQADGAASPGNNENLQQQAEALVAAGGPHMAPAQHVLRPSSRQDNLVAPSQSVACPQGRAKPASPSQFTAAAAGAGQQAALAAASEAGQSGADMLAGMYSQLAQVLPVPVPVPVPTADFAVPVDYGHAVPGMQAGGQLGEVLPAGPEQPPCEMEGMEGEGAPQHQAGSRAGCKRGFSDVQHESSVPAADGPSMQSAAET
ncbi:hypothetical protein D9Q98_004709 [Chlorella vulgaris]|uniref:FCP1 homology domain-containing protein n=1 Tax=Chlorella vulgaris TaxID=3077 RepID=A0A9D4TQF2_CHLVU|nr:hypothetical protein D9Q98_004709 [Chlorella vulgaris]